MPKKEIIPVVNYGPEQTYSMLLTELSFSNKKHSICLTYYLPSLYIFLFVSCTNILCEQFFTDLPGVQNYQILYKKDNKICILQNIVYSYRF